jgi:hypothetical protein
MNSCECDQDVIINWINQYRSMNPQCACHSWLMDSFRVENGVDGEKDWPCSSKCSPKNAIAMASWFKIRSMSTMMLEWIHWARQWGQNMDVQLRPYAMIVFCMLCSNVGWAIWGTWLNGVCECKRLRLDVVHEYLLWGGDGVCANNCLENYSCYVKKLRTS